MKKTTIIILTIFLNLALFSCSSNGDDEVFLENQFEHMATDGDGSILPPPPV